MLDWHMASGSATKLVPVVIQHLLRNGHGVGGISLPFT